MTTTDTRHGKTAITFTGKLLDYKNFRQYSDTFCETGAAAGDGIQRALDAGFQKVVSIEAKDHWFKMCADRFAMNEKVFVLFGKSTDVLKEVLHTLQPSVIFLDAHPSGELSAGHAEVMAGDNSWSQDAIIKAELAIIIAIGVKHVIIIDDVNGLADGLAVQYMALIGEGYEFAFYDENLSGELLYTNKILVATPKMS